MSNPSRAGARLARQLSIEYELGYEYYNPRELAKVLKNNKIPIPKELQEFLKPRRKKPKPRVDQLTLFRKDDHGDR